jgi:cytochrome c peroxidase
MKHRPPRGLRQLAACLVLAATAGLAEAKSPPPPLHTVQRPEPQNLGDFVANKAVAIALGKALFWDMNVGSDGKTACASCHFHAGADTRSKNQLSPGAAHAGQASPIGFVRSASPAALGLSPLSGNLNVQLQAHDFPFHKFADPNNRDSAVVRSSGLIASSQGVFKDGFGAVITGSGIEQVTRLDDDVFSLGGINLRQVPPRNSPTVVNAVFNLRNFWDGRAQTLFNGVNPWGRRDPGARVYKNMPTPQGGQQLTPVAVAINDASLASQASGPPLSPLEMSAEGRQFPDLGRKMLALRPLAQQQIAADDSVLGVYRHPSGQGINVGSYVDAIKAAFKPEWWSSPQTVNIGGRSYNQMEANFSLFWGLALQLYQATLVSDAAPYDRWAAGDTKALSAEQLMGLGVFLGRGKCIACHDGSTFTNAAIRRKPLATERMSRMPMGDGRNAVYDEGFYNIGVTRTRDDLGVGGQDPWGRPLSFSGLTRMSPSPFVMLEQDVPNVSVTSASRIAVNGSFKTPTLRNVELTAPYFHDGSVLTLKQVVQFYNRGGNFAKENIADLDTDIEPLGLSEKEQDALVAFMRALTDERVRRHAAPFDHPELVVPNGHAGDTRQVANDGTGRAVDLTLKLPAVGRGGYAAHRIPVSFEEGLKRVEGAEALHLRLAARHSGKCLDAPGGAALVQATCRDGRNLQWEEVPVKGGFMLRSRQTQQCIDIEGASRQPGARVLQWSCHGGTNQVFQWRDGMLVARHSNQCLDVFGASAADGAALVQWPCHGGGNQRFTLQ